MKDDQSEELIWMIFCAAAIIGLSIFILTQILSN